MKISYHQCIDAQLPTQSLLSTFMSPFARKEFVWNQIPLGGASCYNLPLFFSSLPTIPLCYNPAPIFFFHPLPKSSPLCHHHQQLSQHVYSKHQFNTSPLPASPYHPRHHLWIYVHPVHPILPLLTSCPSQTSLVLQMHTCILPLVLPKPSTFGKPSTMPRSMPLRPEIEPHHRCQ